MRVIKVDDKIPRIDVEVLQRDKGLCHIVLLSDFDISVIRGYLFPFSMWATRLGSFTRDNLFVTASESQLLEFRELIHDLDGRLIVSCDLTGALLEIASALKEISVSQVVNCCSGSGSGSSGTVGNVDTGSGQVPLFGTENPIDLDGGIPDGFDSENEYLMQKCQVANGIADGIIQTLRNWGGITGINAVAIVALMVASVVGFITFPPAGLTILSVSLAAMGSASALFLSLAEKLEERRGELVCTLYSSDSVSVIVSLVSDLLDTCIAAIPATGSIAMGLKTAALLLVNTDTLNKLMEKVAYIQYPDADCACDFDVIEVQVSCPGTQYELMEGEVISGDLQNGSVTLESREIKYLCQYDFVQSAGIQTKNLSVMSVTFSVSAWSSDRFCCEYVDEWGGHHIVIDYINAPQPVRCKQIKIRANEPGVPSYTVDYDYQLV